MSNYLGFRTNINCTNDTLGGLSPSNEQSFKAEDNADINQETLEGKKQEETSNEES
jgi:hypothetical protein